MLIGELTGQSFLTALNELIILLIKFYFNMLLCVLVNAVESMPAVE